MPCLLRRAGKSSCCWARTTRPVLALENWLKIANIKEGYVFRRVGLYGNIGKSRLSGNAIGAIVKRAVEWGKLGDPDDYGGHSLAPLCN